MTKSSAKIVLATYGSFGDLHPYIALALELKRRGHAPVIATSESYRPKIEAENLELYPLRPDVPPAGEEEQLIRRSLDPWRGMKVLFQEFMLADFQASYDDLREATRDADLLISHQLAFAAPLLAEKYRTPWISTVLAPITFFSAYDPSVPPLASWTFNLLRVLPPAFIQFTSRIGERGVRSYVRAVDEMRERVGLPPGAHPLFAGQHSPRLVLALFSKLFAQEQPDYPAQTDICGFPFYDRGDRAGSIAVDPDLLRFLDEGAPPVVFTLGSAAVSIADDFFNESIAAVKLTGQRAVLLVGDKSHLLNDDLPEGVRAFAYAPFGEVFPRAATIVCSAGIGTMAQVMRAGVPTLTVPFTFDQPDNSARLARLGMSRSIARVRYRAAPVAEHLRALATDQTYATRAAEISRAIKLENGQSRACDLIENFLHTNSRQQLQSTQPELVVHN
jgi:UDP:flavonoid glycosyltransferase YjiC (YdhE family)